MRIQRLLDGDILEAFLYKEVYLIPFNEDYKNFRYAHTIEVLEVYFNGLIKIEMKESEGVTVLAIVYPEMKLHGVFYRDGAISSILPRLNYHPTPQLCKELDKDLMLELVAALWAIKTYTVFEFGCNVFSKRILDAFLEGILKHIEAYSKGYEPIKVDLQLVIFTP